MRRGCKLEEVGGLEVLSPVLALSAVARSLDHPGGDLLGKQGRQSRRIETLGSGEHPIPDNASLEVHPMFHNDDNPKLDRDILRIVARQKEVTAAMQPVLDAIEKGMAAFRTVCSLIADKKIVSDTRLASLFSRRLTALNAVAESHHFNTDMRAAQKTLTRP